MAKIITIGEWTFSPDTATLRRGDEIIQIENRAASALEILCGRQGEVVSHSDFIKLVWGDRNISPNSIAVVIGDIRRALKDNARAPKYIATVSKRGYRLLEPVTISHNGAQNGAGKHTIGAPHTSQKRAWGSLAAIAILAITAIIAFTVVRAPKHTQMVAIAVAVGPFQNDTNDPSYDPLSPAMSELVKTELMRLDRIQVTTDIDTDIIVHGKIILWSGHVAVALHAENTKTEALVWSGMASGPEAKLPAQVRREFAELSAALRQ